MRKNDQIKTDNFTLHVMPPNITDDDITALFNGIINVVKKKFELEKNAETINFNLNMEKMVKELKEKQAEIIRLKNEIIFLQTQLESFKNTDQSTYKE